MAQRVEITREVMEKILGHRCQHEVMAAHQRLCDADDPFDPKEVDCYLAPDGRPGARLLITGSSVMVEYWRRPDHQVEIYAVITEAAVF